MIFNKRVEMEGIIREPSTCETAQFVKDSLFSRNTGVSCPMQTTLVGVWQASKERTVTAYVSSEGKIHAYVRKHVLDLGGKSKRELVEKIPPHKIHLGLQKAPTTPESLSLLRERNFTVVLQESLGELEVIFLPKLQGAADSSQSGDGIRDGIRRALDNIRNNPRRATSHDEFIFATQRAQRNSEVLCAEDFLHTCHSLAQAKLEIGEFEHSLSCCKQLLELFYVKGLASRYEEDLLNLLDKLKETLVQRALFEQALAYLELGIDVTEKNQALAKQLLWLRKVGDTNLQWMIHNQGIPNLPSEETFQKGKIALSYFCSAYHLSQNHPELQDFSKESFQALLRVEGLYLEMKTREEIITSDRRKVKKPFIKLLKYYTEEKRSPVYWKKLTEEQKKSLLKEMEFIADYLGVRGCFETANRFYLVLCELALSLGENIESIEAKKDDMYNEKIPAVLLEKAQEGRNMLAAIRKEALTFLQKGAITAENQGEISQKYQRLVELLLKECKLFLDPLEEYPIAFMSFGSLNRKEMAPFSDIEGAFLISNPLHYPFITTLCELLHLKVMALGETQEFVIGRKKSLLSQGFSLESKYPPLQLSGLPEQLALRQTKPVDDPVPINLLRSTSYLFGKKELYHEYYFHLCKVLNDHEGSLRMQHAVERMKDYTEMPVTSLKADVGNEFEYRIDVKETLLRVPVFIFEALCLYHGVLGIVNTCQRIEALIEKGHFPKVLREKFQEYFEFAFYLRYKAHLTAQKEEDTLLLSPVEKAKTADLINTLLLPLIQTAKRWLTDKSAFVQGGLFAQAFLAHGKELIKRKNYSVAANYFHGAVCLQGEDKSCQIVLGNLSFFLKDVATASKAWQKALSILEAMPSGWGRVNCSKEKHSLLHLTSLLKEQGEIQAALERTLGKIGQQEKAKAFADLEEEVFLSQSLDKPLPSEYVAPFYKVIREVLSQEEGGLSHFDEFYSTLPEVACREIKKQMVPYLSDHLKTLEHFLCRRGYVFSPVIKQERWLNQLLYWIQSSIETATSGQEPLVRVEGVDLRKGFFTRLARASLFQGREFKGTVAGSNQEVSFIEENQIKKGYFKKHPESPGDEYAVFLLNHLLTGQGSPPGELLEVQTVGGKYFLFASQAVEGEPLHHFLSNELNLQKLSQIDKKQFSQMVLMAFLTCPEDGKPDNYIVQSQGEKIQLIGVDNEHVFARPFIGKLTGKATSDQLFIKTILFCFDQMKEPFHEEVRKTFLKVDPAAVLEEWLKELSFYNKKVKGLFSYEALNEQWTNGRLLPFYLSSGQLQMLYEKMLYLQRILKKGAITHLDLLQKWDLRLSKLYEEALDQYATPQGRFVALTKGAYKREEPCDFSRTQTTLLQIKEGSLKGPLNTLESFESRRYTPEEGLFHLKSIEKAAQYKKQIETQLEENWQSLDMRALLLESFQEEILAKKNWKKANLEDLNKVSNIPYKKVTLQNFIALRDPAFERFLIYCAHPFSQEVELKELDLEGCINLTVGSIDKVRDLCQRLEIFSLKKSAITKWDGVSFPYLRILNLSYCLGLEKVNMTSGILEELNLEYCSSLENVALRCSQLSAFHIKGCTKLLRKGFSSSLDTPVSLRAFDQLKKIETVGAFVWEDSVTPKELQILSSALQRADRIETITLILHSTPSSPKKHQESWQLNLSEHPTLKRLVVESSALESLILSNCPHLDDLILACPSLKKIDIRGCKKLVLLNGLPSLQEIIAVIHMLYADSTSILDLSKRKIEKRDLFLLWDALRENKSIQTLNLSTLRILEEGKERGLNIDEWTSLVKILRKKASLETLILSNNWIGNIGAQILANMLEKNQFLHNLDLSSNLIGDIGMEILAKSLSKNRGLMQLDLSENCSVRSRTVSSNTPPILSKASIKSASLEILSLRGCRDLTELTLDCPKLRDIDIEGCVSLRGFDKENIGRKLEEGDSAFSLKRISLVKRA